MRPLVLLLALTVAASGAAGCLSAGHNQGQGKDPHDGKVPRDWAASAVPHGDGHDHRDRSQHAGLSTPNFQLLGYDPLETAYHGRTSGSYFCGDAKEAEDGRRLAFVHSFWSDVAFTIADVTDPKAPRIVGELALPLTHVYDTAVTPDLAFVVLGTSVFEQGLEKPPSPAATDLTAPTFVDACTGERRPVAVASEIVNYAPFDAGVVLVDVRDPANPVVADYVPLPALGAHSVFATEVDGARMALASVTNLEHDASYFAFFTIEETPAGGKLVLESAYRPPREEPTYPVTNGHVDGWIHEHPVTGGTIAYLADWDGGLVVVDLADPKLPREIARWDHRPPGASGNDAGNIHGAWPLPTTWDGRHYTFVGQEVTRRPGETPSGAVFVLDTTDPANPQRVGAWTLPVDVTFEEVLMFSTHYYRVLDRTLFVAMYHGGVWAVDLTDLANPVARGVFVPDREPPNPPEELGYGQYDWTPIVLDLEVFESDGTVLVWDGTSGVYTLRFNDDARFPAPPPWPVPESA